MVPELDANRVRRWAHDKTPPEFRDEMRVEVDETPRGLTILECRPPWSDLIGSEWTRAPIARITYSKQAAEWTLYYADRSDRFQRYWECGPSAHVADLLAEIDADPTCIFWGCRRSTPANTARWTRDVEVVIGPMRWNRLQRLGRRRRTAERVRRPSLRLRVPRRRVRTPPWS